MKVVLLLTGRPAQGRMGEEDTAKLLFSVLCISFLPCTHTHTHTHDVTVTSIWPDLVTYHLDRITKCTFPILLHVSVRMDSAASKRICDSRG